MNGEMKTARVAVIAAELAGMDGNRTHPGRLSSARKRF